MNNKILTVVITVGLLFSVKSYTQTCTQNLLTTSQASIAASGTTGFCLFCTVTNTSNVVDNNTATAATVVIPLGVGGAGYIEINLGATYTSGTRVGFLVDVNGGVAAALNSITLTAYNNSTVVGTANGGSLLNIVGLGGQQTVSAIFCGSYNKLRISMGSLAGLIATYNVYGVFVEDQCNFPGTCSGCNAGIISPLLSTTNINNVCGATTANLTTIAASNTPNNTSLSWHTAIPCTAANVVTTPSAVVAGTYYAAFKDTINNCYSGSAATAVTVAINALPSVAAITGSNVVDVGGNITLANATNGGVWSSSNTAIATINTTGVVTGIVSSTTTILYTVTNIYGCNNAAIFLITINPKSNG